MGVRSYRDLKVWQAAMELVLRVYELSQAFPAQERYGLCSQIQRAAVSIPSNIAEGHARDSTRDFLHHLSFSLGSLAELETQLTLAERLGYTDAEITREIEFDRDELGKMLRGLQKALKSKL